MHPCAQTSNRQVLTPDPTVQADPISAAIALLIFVFTARTLDSPLLRLAPLTWPLAVGAHKLPPLLTDRTPMHW